MSFQIVSKKVAAAVFAAFTVFTASAIAQTANILPPVTGEPAAKTWRVAERNNLYCAGYVQTKGMDTSRRVVGAVEEQDGFHYSERNVLYINSGADKNVQVGDVFTVVRPRGKVQTRWTDKGDIGYYVQEVGALEVVRVKEHVSVVKVKTSCDNILLGDLVEPMPVRVAPVYTPRQPLELFGEPSGKAVGHLMFSRDNNDLIARDFIVYVDLGEDDNVQVGDYLTVFRPLGEGNPFQGDWDRESVSARDYGWQSFEYRGARFSNQAGRKSGDHADGRVVTAGRAKEGRPDVLRKVVGEMVILNVREKTATALVTRNASEIHPGDWVEVQ